MRALALIALLSVAMSRSHEARRPRPSERALAATPSVRIAYDEPEDLAHRRLYAEVKRRRVLEQMAEAVSVIRLPKTLTLTFAACDGESNAFYAKETASVIFCYEYLADVVGMARKAMNAEPPEEAIDGPVVFVFFHEMAHAVFDLLEVPILGKEEDAADFFAALALLRMGDEMALRMLRGAAWAYLAGAQSAQLDVSDFSDNHSLDTQRYYNILCLAYGSDEKYFATAVTSGNLPEERAEGCRAEFQQVRHALDRLIMPSIERPQLEHFLKSRGVNR